MVNFISSIMILALLLPLRCFGEVTPFPVPSDSRLRTVPYQADQVFNIPTQVGITTHIIFAENEIFEKWYSGDNKAFVLTSHRNYVSFKPIVTNSATNLFIITNKRHYNFSTTIAKANGFFGIRFTYPEDERLLRVKADNASRIKDSVDPSKQLDRNNRYVGLGSAVIRPDAVFDNGTHTFFHFAEETDFPAVYRVFGEDEEKITQSTTNGNWLVVPRVQQAWKLRLGLEVLCIKNLGFASGRPANKSGTSHDRVIRIIKEGT